MLLPRFSIRATLTFITAAALVFVVAGFAYRGELWAWGVTIALFSLAVTALVHAAWFGLVWMFAQMPTTNAAIAARATAPAGNPHSPRDDTADVSQDAPTKGPA